MLPADGVEYEVKGGRATSLYISSVASFINSLLQNKASSFPSKRSSMSGNVADAAMGRAVGGSEYTWCRAVPGGTGIAVLAFLLSKPPLPSCLETALHKLQNTHPVLNSTLHFNSNSSSFSFLTSSPNTPFLKVQSFDLSATSALLVPHHDSTVSPFQQILERQLNHNSWNHDHYSHQYTNVPVLFATIYSLPDETWAVVLRLHVAACDRTTAASLLRELLPLTMEEEEGVEGRKKKETLSSKLSLAIEDLVPSGKGVKKGVWARGMDMLVYSLNSLRLTNLKFEDTRGRRCSQVVRLQLNRNETDRVLAGCRKKGIKLCGVLTAAGMMAAHGSKKAGKKYGVVTLIDCRPTLHPPLSPQNFGARPLSPLSIIPFVIISHFYSSKSFTIRMLSSSFI